MTCSNWFMSLIWETTMTKLWEQHSIISNIWVLRTWHRKNWKVNSIAWLVLSMFLRVTNARMSYFPDWMRTCLLPYNYSKSCWQMRRLIRKPILIWPAIYWKPVRMPNWIRDRTSPVWWALPCTVPNPLPPIYWRRRNWQIWIHRNW